MRVAVGIGACMRVIVADPAGLLACGLVADELSILYDIEALCLDTLVVEADRCQPASLCSVADDIDDIGCILERSKKVGCHERCPRIVRLEPESTIELGRMTDRLVDHQPCMR